MYGILHICPVSVGLDNQIWSLFYLYNRTFECPKNIQKDIFPEVKKGVKNNVISVKKGESFYYFS